MNVTVDRKQAVDALTKLGRVCNGKAPRNIFNQVRIAALDDKRAVFTAMNTETALTFKLDAEVQKAGVVLTDLHNMKRVLQRSKRAESVSIEQADDEAVLGIGNLTVSKKVECDPAEYPLVPYDGPRSNSVAMAGNELSRILRHTQYAADKESTRYALGGVLLELDGEELIAVATDGKHLVTAQTKVVLPSSAPKFTNADDRPHVIVPVAVASLLADIFKDDPSPVLLSAKPDHIAVSHKSVSLHARLLDGRFPIWRDVTKSLQPSGELPTSTVDAKQLLAHAIEVSGAADVEGAKKSNGGHAGMELYFDGERLVLQADGVCRATLGMGVMLQGDLGKERSKRIYIQPHYLVNFLRAVDTPEVEIYLTDPESPMFVNTPWLTRMLLMPLASKKN